MSVTQYIGARYVPLFADPLEWSSTEAYEPLTIVYYQGNSYTSRQSVPAGLAAPDNESVAQYWAITGNYNAQIEQYRQEVRTFDGRITTNAANITTLTGDLADEMTAREAADTALSGDIASEATAREAADTALSGEIEKINIFSDEKYSELSFDYVGQTISTSNYIYPQGACYIPTENCIVYYLNQIKKIIKCSLTGIKISEANISLGHGNSLFFANGHIYAYGNFSDSSLYKINPSSLAVENVITIPIENFSVENSGYAAAYNPNNNKIYLFGNGNINSKMVIVNADSFAIESVNSFATEIQSNIGAVTINQNILYIASYGYGNYLSLYDLNSNEWIANYRVNDFLGGNILLEIESLIFINGELYITSVCSASDIMLIGKLGKGIKPNYLQSYNSPVTVYVDENSNNLNFCDGTNEHPFANVSQASALGAFMPVTIICKSDCAKTFYAPVLKFPVFIDAKSHNFGNSRLSQFTQLFFINCANQGNIIATASTLVGEPFGIITKVGGGWRTTNPILELGRTTLKSAVSMGSFENVSLYGGGSLEFIADGPEILITNCPTSRPSGNAKQISGFGIRATNIIEGCYIPAGTYLGQYNGTTYMFGSTPLSGTYTINLSRDGGWFKCTNVNLPNTIFYKVAD